MKAIPGQQRQNTITRIPSVQQQLGPSRATRDRSSTDHVFVNNVRFLGMISIIAIHAGPGAAQLTDARAGWLVYQVLDQVLKFGTIGFFLISGFLLGERLETYQPLEYLRRRMRNTVKPWAVWACVFLVIVLAGRTLYAPDAFDSSLKSSIEIVTGVVAVVFHSIYWFIPNFLIALAVLLLFRRYVNDPRFGAILLSLSVLYGVNVYTRWFPSEHTTAVFGFVFYLWLGIQFARHRTRISGLMQRVRPSVLWALVAVTGGIAFLETIMLNRINPDDALNTLRLTNQIYSVVVFLAFIGIRTKLWPRFMDVRANTFGLYLIHPLMLWAIPGVLDAEYALWTGAPFGAFQQKVINQIWMNPMSGLAFWGLMFFGIYGAALMVTRWMVSRPRLKWLIGQ
jgi:Acyltransferase family